MPSAKAHQMPKPPPPPGVKAPAGPGLPPKSAPQRGEPRGIEIDGLDQGRAPHGAPDCLGVAALDCEKLGRQEGGVGMAPAT